MCIWVYGYVFLKKFIIYNYKSHFAAKVLADTKIIKKLFHTLWHNNFSKAHGCLS